MIHRRSCPVCFSAKPEVCLRVAYDSVPMREHFKRLGAEIRFEVLKDHFFEIAHCSECLLLYQTSVLADDDLGMLYNTNSSKSSAPPFTSLISLVHFSQDALLMRQLVRKPTAIPQLLDYGLGWGRFAMAAQALGFAVSGVEISECCREHSRKHGIKLLDTNQLPEAEFDAVIVDQVLEHLGDPRKVLQEVARSLKPGGFLLAGTPGVPGVETRLRRAGTEANPLAALTDRDLDAISPLIHTNLFNAHSLKVLAQYAGLTWYRPPLRTALASGMLWNSPRQWNRNLNVPIKYWLGKGTRLWFRKS